MKSPEKEEMIDALKRSGYLLESQISKELAKRNFFVESNQVIQDPFTGKSREIDIVAELNDRREESTQSKCKAKVKLVFEIKNNTSPMVLLTDFQFSPSAEDWNGIKEIMTYPTSAMYRNSYQSFWNKLILNSEDQNCFTQYCSFQQKKDKKADWMALHPDTIHSGISKITQYCEEFVEDWGRESIDENSGYFRKFVSIPVLLIADDLYELTSSEEEELKLSKVNSSILVNTYHFRGKPQMAYIYVVTKDGLSEFIEKMVDLERETEADMINFQQQLKR